MHRQHAGDRVLAPMRPAVVRGRPTGKFRGDAMNPMTILNNGVAASRPFAAGFPERFVRGLPRLRALPYSRSLKRDCSGPDTIPC